LLGFLPFFFFPFFVFGSFVIAFFFPFFVHGGFSPPRVGVEHLSTHVDGFLNVSVRQVLMFVSWRVSFRAV
jgi:hypothetical protein